MEGGTRYSLPVRRSWPLSHLLHPPQEALQWVRGSQGRVPTSNFRFSVYLLCFSSGKLLKFFGPRFFICILRKYLYQPHRIVVRIYWVGSSKALIKCLACNKNSNANHFIIITNHWNEQRNSKHWAHYELTMKECHRIAKTPKNLLVLCEVN